MYDYETFLRRLLNIPLRWFLANSDAGIAFNTAAKAYYIKKYDYPSEKIFVATNLIDTDKVELERRYFSPMVITKRQELGLKGMKTVLFVGCLEPAKRVDCLIRAFAAIQPKVANVVLLIVGDGSARSDLEKLSVELKLDNVIFLGRHITDANLYFMLGDIFVLPGLGGLAISQAMSHGLPVISGKADGTELDLIINGKNGYILSSNNPVSEISQKLVMLLLDDSLRIKMGRESRRLISEKFNINRTASIFAQTVRSVLK
jgi:glycosyltransferase involved in cell wall biosynthesis